MPRISFYDTPHKGLRNAFAQFSVKACNTDFSSKEEVTTLTNVGRELMTFLHAHAHGENDFYSKDLMAKDANLATRLLKEHEDVEARQAVVEKVLETLPTTPQGDALHARGKELYASFNAFHSFYTHHMLEEEEVTQGLIWNLFSDEDLMNFSKRVVGTYAPQDMAMMARYILPALNPMERAVMVKGMKMGMPAPAFENVLRLAQSVLPPSAFERLQRDLN